MIPSFANGKQAYKTLTRVKSGLWLGVDKR